VVAGVVVVFLALSAALYAGLHGARATAAGCVDVIAASTTGGATVHACGAAAAHWCRLEATRDDAFARAIQARCGRAGYR
jgi:hypothetical protein